MRAAKLKDSAFHRCALLIDHLGSKKKLATLLEECGVKESWWYKFMDGRVQSPGVNNLDLLLDALDEIEKAER